MDSIGWELRSDLAAPQGLEAGEHPQQGGLARAVGAQQRHHLAALDEHVDPEEHLHVAVARGHRAALRARAGIGLLGADRRAGGPAAMVIRTPSGRRPATGAPVGRVDGERLVARRPRQRRCGSR